MTYAAAETGTDVVLALVVLLVFGLPVLVVVAPPVVMAGSRRWSRSGVALWLVGVALAVGWGVAWNAGMDRADATGDSGSLVGELGWLVAAVAAATASIVLAVRPRGIRG